MARQSVFRRGIQGLVLDPWNEFEHPRTPHQTETESISESLGKIRRFARQHSVHVWVVAHPQKLYRQKKDEPYPIPTPYDIAGSAHWRNKADNCLTIWRDESNQDGEVWLYVQKIRFQEVGRCGDVRKTWDRLSGRYEAHLRDHPGCVIACMP